MDRYKTYHCDERRFLRVSLMPKEFELVWSVILGVWFTCIMSQDIILSDYPFIQNFFYVTLILSFLMGYFILMAFGFAKAFRSGSLRVYGFLIWLSFLQN